LVRVSAASHPRTLANFGTDHVVQLHEHALLPGRAWTLLVAAYLVVLIAGIRIAIRGAKGMSRPGRIVVVLVAVWTIGGAVVGFVDVYTPTGDWRGGVVEASFAALYGLVAAGIVWAVEQDCDPVSRRPGRLALSALSRKQSRRWAAP
jgi:hypothetical protein